MATRTPTVTKTKDKHDDANDSGLDNAFKPPRRIAVLFDAPRAHPIRHAQEKIGEWRRLGFDVTTRLECATTRSSQKNRQIAVSMPVAICITGTINDH